MLNSDTHIILSSQRTYHHVHASEHEHDGMCVGNGGDGGDGKAPPFSLSNSSLPRVWIFKSDHKIDDAMSYVLLPLLFFFPYYIVRTCAKIPPNCLRVVISISIYLAHLSALFRVHNVLFICPFHQLHMI